MSVIPEYIDDFYAGKQVTIPTYGHNGEAVLPVAGYENDPNLTDLSITAKLGEIAANWQVLQHGSYTFEVCGVNGALTDDCKADAMLQIPSIHSSISTNPGNAYEFALQAVQYPDLPQIYVAALGSGGSQGLSSEERRYVRKTGRMTHDNEGRGRALPTIQALNTALLDHGVRASRISTDSSGGKLGTALAAELEPGQLTNACYSAMPNMCDVSGLGLAAAMVKEGQWNSRRYLNSSPDDWKVSAHRVAMTKDVLGEFYETVAEKKPAAEHSIRNTAQIYWMARKSVGLGPNSGNPLLQDTLTVLARQPEAKLRYICGSADPLCPEKELMSNLPAFLGNTLINASDVEIIVLPGLSHNANAHFPSFVHAAKAAALDL